MKLLIQENDFKELESSEVVRIDTFFLKYNKILTKFRGTCLKSVGYGFMCNNIRLGELFAPDLVKIGYSFLYSNKNLVGITAPKSQLLKGYFLNPHIARGKFLQLQQKKINHESNTNNIIRTDTIIM